MSRGVNVIEQDLDQGLSNFNDDAFDMVIMTETIQSVREPERLLKEMLRVGRECVVTFPNFGHWRCRTVGSQRQDARFEPSSPPLVRHAQHSLVYLQRLQSLCADLRIHIIQRRVVNQQHEERSVINLAPNLFGSYGFYHLGRPL